MGSRLTCLKWSSGFSLITDPPHVLPTKGAIRVHLALRTGVIRRSYWREATIPAQSVHRLDRLEKTPMIIAGDLNFVGRLPGRAFRDGSRVAMQWPAATTVL